VEWLCGVGLLSLLTKAEEATRVQIEKERECGGKMMRIVVDTQAESNPQSKKLEKAKPTTNSSQPNHNSKARLGWSKTYRATGAVRVSSWYTSMSSSTALAGYKPITP
jgi:hypothetical protein